MATIKCRHVNIIHRFFSSLQKRCCGKLTFNLYFMNRLIGCATMLSTLIVVNAYFSSFYWFLVVVGHLAFSLTRALARTFTFTFSSLRSFVGSARLFLSMGINLRIVFIIKSLRWLYGHTFAAMCGYIVNFMANRALMIFSTTATRDHSGSFVCHWYARTAEIFGAAHSLSPFATQPQRRTLESRRARDSSEATRCRNAIIYASPIRRCHDTQLEITNLFLLLKFL